MRTAKTIPLLTLILTLVGCDDNEQVTTASTATTSTTESECVPRDVAPDMPATATAYADLCSRLLGEIPVADCGEGVRIPIYVDGEEVFETPADGVCDDAGFKGACDVGSTIRRQEGQTAEGEPLPDVVWVTFCRAVDLTWEPGGLGSVQMIGYDSVNGATCFFESPDALGSQAQTTWVSLNSEGILDGELPGPGHADYDNAWIPPPAPCSECHHNDPFVHNPWIDGAKLPEDPTQPVLPVLATTTSPYWVMGGPYWDLRTPHIEGNTCVGCHRIGMGTIDIFEFLVPYGGGVIVSEFMPPYAPGTHSEDLEALRACWEQGPDNTPNCEWVNPPGEYCDDE